MSNFGGVKQSSVIILLLCVAAFASCGSRGDGRADRLNGMAYGYHYRDLDSAMAFARRAYAAAEGYGRGRAEALNNMAFVSIARMDYAGASRQLAGVADASGDDVERGVADVQMMRVCQRQSRNKDFYIYKRRAWEHLNAAQNRRQLLSARQRARLDYAWSLKAIVESAYYYYVGLESHSREAINQIDPGGTVAKDTAQLLCYYYNMGSGGMVADSTDKAVKQREFDYLLRCYLLSRQMDFAYWEANAMQALCEHLLDDGDRRQLSGDNPKEIDFINTNNVPVDSLPADLARRALATFSAYGDVYQTAGAYRTLAQCYWHSGNYDESIRMLDTAISRDTAINQAPDLVASICEQFSLAYSAIDFKPESDYYRNLYLDMQEQTRQDRKLEARAEQLRATTLQLNTVIAVCAVLLVIIVAALLWITIRRGGKIRTATRDRLDELREQTEQAEQECLNNKQRNLEQRAKVALVEEITPLINRITRELEMLDGRGEDANLRQERMDYVAELAAKINEYNAVLTDWIQIRQGRLRLHIETFALSGLFEIIKRNSPEMERAGVELRVGDTECEVKADRTLTLFMLNTMIDNARRYTKPGGSITVAARQLDDSVELSVSDTGEGMTRQKLDSLFSHTAPHNHQTPQLDNLQPPQPFGATAQPTRANGHGFGLLNCKGIIEHYRKTSQFFSVCRIEAESRLGKGTTIKFRLPKGVRRVLAVCLALVMPHFGLNAATDETLRRAAAYADSTISCNIGGDYQAALAYADSCIFCLNSHYFSLHRSGTHVMTVSDESASGAAELQWWRDGEPTDFQAILVVRNEMAVAALAVHDWALYAYNNKVYTQLFRMVSADMLLDEYVNRLNKTEKRKNWAVVVLILMLVGTYPLYYFASLRRQRALVARAGERVAAAEEQLRCAELQRDRYYINNSVMDNCLSTLKHETMFYPSRLCSLIASGQGDTAGLRSLALYYKEIFSQLSLMAVGQTLHDRCIDADMLRYMLQLMGELGGDVASARAEGDGGAYQTLRVVLPNMPYDEAEASRLFSPTTADVRFIMLRQLVREIGDKLGAHACGIRAAEADGHTEIRIRLTRGVMEKIIGDIRELNGVVKER